MTGCSSTYIDASSQLGWLVTNLCDARGANWCSGRSWCLQSIEQRELRLRSRQFSDKVR